MKRIGPKPTLVRLSTLRSSGVSCSLRGIRDDQETMANYGNGGLGSLTPSRRAPPVPGSSTSGSTSQRSADTFVPPLSSYASSSNQSLPKGQGAGGGSYTGPLRPAGPGAVAGNTAGSWSSNASSGTSGGSGGVVRKGYVSVKEDGLRSWIWSKRWLALREQTLTFHKNEVCCEE